ncbi:polymer-forming cytoskeletal protein [Anaerocolumna sp. AGMB13020]|uniref:bactofilin family protein n=1 Tax=Anaerocolumna sp. AGMB13020 TaxID=3081750 RepID=UPI0029552076|nr:polymer-forming cytoskeletal protein [Anaerocolumna sp. AGMB13020]WOO36408.1 polymer-forming cytoskeletal protein [Anaerocolumna sp. AGMB13020]
MGFFKDFKDDLSQAVNELLPEEVLESEKEGNTSGEKDNVLRVEGEESVAATESDVQADTSTDSVETSEEDNVDKELLEALLTNETDVEEVKSQELAAALEEEEKEDQDTANADEVTVIAKSTVISGNLSTDGSLEVIGTIKGDIDCKGKLSVIGKVTGNCSAAEVYIGAKRFEGAISSEGNVRIGLGTVIIGDVLGTECYIAGAVKGDVDINGPVVIDSSAVIKGNIKAASIQINTGAVIDGFCSLSYASVNIDNIFE